MIRHLLRSAAPWGVALLLLSLPNLPARAATWQVSQASGAERALLDALAQAQHGDTVLVGPGEYKGHFTLPSGVTLQSLRGADSTRLVGDGRTGILEASDCDSFTVVQGFTFEGGRATALHRLHFEGGGGILAWRSALHILDNIFRDNHMEVGKAVGGAVALFECPAWIERNVFDSNSANQGGALFARDCSLLVVRGNHAVHNAADEDGGAFLFDLHTHGWVEFNVVERNQAAWGGGMSLGRLSGMAVSNNTVVGNYARQWGGGIFIVDSRPLLVRNLVAENRSNFKGGGIAGGRAAFPDLRCNVAWHNVPNNYLSGEDSTETPGEGAVSEADPLFCNYLAGDFHPSPDGPAANGMCGVVGALPADCPRIQKILR